MPACMQPDVQRSRIHPGEEEKEEGGGEGNGGVEAEIKDGYRCGV